MARPTHVDSQRIISLLDEMQKKVRVLNWLTDENLGQVEYNMTELLQILPSGIVQELMNHQAYVQAFNDTNIKGDGKLIDFTELEVDYESLEDSKDAAQKLEKSTLKIARDLNLDSETLKYLTTVMPDTSSSGICGFLDISRDLRKLCLTKLMTPIEEEMSRERELEEIEEKLRKAKEEEAAWSEKLTSLRKQREDGRENRNKEIQKLKAELGEVKSNTEKSQQKIERESNSRMTASEESFLDKMNHYNQQIEKLKKEVEDLVREDKDREQNWLKQKATQTRKIEDKITAYDKEMIENNETLDRETKTYIDKRRDLEMLDDQIRQLRLEKKRMEEEAKRELLKRKNYDEMIKQRNMAAEFIQAHWKGLKTRQEFDKLKKKNRKGRRKGKGKGK